MNTQKLHKMVSLKQGLKVATDEEDLKNCIFTKCSRVWGQQWKMLSHLWDSDLECGCSSYLAIMEKWVKS